MSPSVIIAFLIGAVVAGIAAWFFSASRAQARQARELSDLRLSLGARIAELEGAAKGAEGLLGELRQQIGERDNELASLRSELVVERQAKVEALTRLDAAQKGLEEQKALIEEVKREMIDTFNALSAAALKSSNEDFLRLASERLDRVVSDTKGRLGEHQAALDGMIKPLSETLKRYEEQVRLIEESRHKAYGSLEEQLRTLALTHEGLQKETSKLVTALRKPHVRGRWGEMQLRRVAELSGMAMHCDFTEQQSLDTEKGRIRPDMIVHLPAEREIVVDSKVSLEAYLDAVAANTEEERRSGMQRHTQQVRTHMQRLASKDYWSQFRQSPEFVVMFIPGESFLSAALEIDATLIEDGIQKGVIIATPMTFVALLRAIAFGWRQEQLTKNAQEVSVLGRELYERIAVMARHFEDLGRSIERSIGSYNKIVGSLESRVLPSVRRFRELGVSAAEEIPVIDQIDQKPRNLEFPGRDGE